jgi:hypothetical protein
MRRPMRPSTSSLSRTRRSPRCKSAAASGESLCGAVRKLFRARHQPSQRPDSRRQRHQSESHDGANPSVTAAAYINGYYGAAVTTLYGIDTSLDTLVLQSPPNFGVLNTIGDLGIDVTAVAGSTSRRSEISGTQPRGDDGRIGGPLRNPTFHVLRARVRSLFRLRSVQFTADRTVRPETC